MKSSSQPTLTSRVLKFNVGFLLSAGPGTHQDSRLDIPEAIKFDDGTRIEQISGALRITRAKEGILVQAELEVVAHNSCARCGDPVEQTLGISIEDLFASPPVDWVEFSVATDGNLDLAPLIRAETIIAMSHRVLCRAECQGLCPTCGINRNYETCHCADDIVDPRLAKLRELLNGTE